MHIPVVDERTITRQPDYYLVLSWNFLDFLIGKYETFLIERREVHRARADRPRARLRRDLAVACMGDVIVAGSTGFIGSHLSRACAATSAPARASWASAPATST